MMLTGIQVPTLVLVLKPEVLRTLAWLLMLKLVPPKTLRLPRAPVWPPMLKPELPKMLALLLEPNSRRLEACDVVRPSAPRFGAS